MIKNIKKYSSNELAFFKAYYSNKSKLPQNYNITQSREKALSWLKINGIANKSIESYHYSNIQKQFNKDQDYNKINTNILFKEIINHPTISVFNDIEYSSIVFMDGELRLDLSNLNLIFDKININSLADLVNKNKLPDYLINNFIKNTNQNVIDNLSRVMWRDGLILNINKNINKNNPIYLIFVTSNKKNSAQINRHYITTAKNINATLIEIHINLSNNTSFNLHHFDYNLDINTNLDHFIVNGENKKTTNICRINGSYNDNVILNSKILSIGGLWTRREGDLFCNGTNINLKISGITLTNNNQHIDNTYIIHHKLPKNISFQHFKNIANNKSCIIFQGKIIVYIDAKKTKGYQKIQSILLNDSAKINCKPELEIHNDDVECTHGATIGSLDEDVLFYLRSRGISLPIAKKILIQGFITEIIDTLPNKIYKPLNELIIEWLKYNII